MNLEKLIQQCSLNNRAAQEKVYRLFASKLFALCLKYSPNYEDAQDTLQDSFIAIFKKINQYKNIGSFEGWIKRVTINTALEKYRKKSPLQLVKEETVEETEEVEYDDSSVSIDFLLQCIQELPDRYRLVFNLYVLDKYSHNEIATMLEISPGTSKSNLSRAKLILKEKIETHLEMQKSCSYEG
ncbi:RNA polymerase sigma factor [Tenacibaculum sp. SG-28]|uniref:RNA polymerase sigma factor n=1 Tax=Tenacibaculum sp. SG-28 TaxID=754426 RepID=UPI000CF43E18|nr:sigma-70 family RNA polymerase sigma factor [Tenacibaculum sp. SG-28]PQJ21854.1 RNA polymerase subunit sigma-70 [Tenacibaculum sp. SG-28]